jgi:tRNA (uracil-5-)-methyltransferase
MPPTARTSEVPPPQKPSYDTSPTSQPQTYPPPPPVKPLDDIITPLWHLPYAAQLALKRRDVASTLRKFHRLLLKDCRQNNQDPPPFARRRPNFPVDPIVPSPSTAAYRNKADFTIALDQKNSPTVGFLAGRFRDGQTAVVAPDGAKNISDVAVRLARAMTEFVAASPLPTVDKTRGGAVAGVWRRLTVREGWGCDGVGRALVALVQINPAGVPRAALDDELARLEHVLTAGVPELTGLLIQEYEGVSNAAPDDTPYFVKYGVEFVWEKIGPLLLRVSPTSFFQVNSAAAELLFSLVKSWVNEVAPAPLILDVCCGAGSIGLFVSDPTTKVVGLEICAAAVRDAEANAVGGGGGGC